jgi:hypothetical protein
MRVAARERRALRYFYRPAANGERGRDAGRRVWHIRGPSWNSWLGLDVTRWRARRSGSRSRPNRRTRTCISNGAQIAGSLHGHRQAEPGEVRLSRQVDGPHRQGGDRAGKPFILDSGAVRPGQMSGSTPSTSRRASCRSKRCAGRCGSCRSWSARLTRRRHTPARADVPRPRRPHADALVRADRAVGRRQPAQRADRRPASTPSSTPTR